MLSYMTYLWIFTNSIFSSVSCLTCKEVLELPEKTKLKLDDLQTLKSKDIVECLSHLGRQQIILAEAEYIWNNVIEFYNGISFIPDDVLGSLHWVTIAVTPEDYSNLTLNDIGVISNFGVNYGLSMAQLEAIADRVREDFGRKQPEDYTCYDLTALNQILCAFNRSEIDRIHPKAYKEAAIIIGKLKNCNYDVMQGFSRLAVHKNAFGPSKIWSQAIIDDLGIVADIISKDLKKSIVSIDMTTASVLLTVGTTWSANSDICNKDERVGRIMRNVAAVAAKELRETPATREQALRIMRDWIQQNGDIKNVRQDEAFLLRFLRHKKYSIPMAQQTLLKYLSLRKFYPSIFTKLDCENPNIKDIINNGYIAVSPVRDSKGRRVIAYNMGKFDPIKYNCWDMCRAHIIVYESLMEDSEDQIFGFTHVGDGSGSTTGHVTSWNPVDFARLIKWGEQSLPMRHKEFQLFNVPAALKYIIDFATSKVSSKMSERLNIHTNIKNLQNQVDVSCLPTSFGGHIPLQDMITYTQDLLFKKRQTVLALDNMELLSTRGIISSRKPTNALKGDSISVEGSFRKLEID